MSPIVNGVPPCAHDLQVVYSTDCTFTVLSHAQNYTRFLLKLVSGRHHGQPATTLYCKLWQALHLFWHKLLGANMCQLMRCRGGS